jgi:hypothetical protein
MAVYNNIILIGPSMALTSEKEWPLVVHQLQDMDDSNHLPLTYLDLFKATFWRAIIRTLGIAAWAYNFISYVMT